MTNGHSQHIDRAILVLIFLCLLAFSLHHIVAYDFWWQLKTGQLIRETGFPVTDTFSYGFPGRVWIEVRWLYCVAISLIYGSAGPAALIIAKAALLSLAGFCLWLIGRGKTDWAMNLGLLAALVLAHQRFMVRPELVTYVLLAAFLLLIQRFQNSGKLHWLIPLPFLQVLWVNSHTLYILGPVVLWLFAGSELIGHLMRWPRDDDRPSLSNFKWLALISIGATLACLVNPYGVRGALFAFELFSETMSDKALNGLITELRSPFSAAGFNVLFVSYCLGIAVSALGFLLRRRAASIGWLAVWAAFLYLSVLAERNTALFGIVACVTIIINFGSITARPFVVWSARIVCGLFAVVMIPLLVSNYYYRSLDPDHKFGLGIAERRFPIRAMEFVGSAGLPLPVMTGLAESGYVMFKLGPNSVYADGRLEVYGPANAAEAINTFSTGNGLLETTERLNVFTLIAHLEKDIVLVRRLIGDPAWTAVYFDDSHIVFLRNSPSTKSQANRLKINWQDPQPISADLPPGLRAGGWLTGIFPSVSDSSSSRTLGQLFLLAGNVPKAQSHLEDAVRQWPDDPAACFPLGIIYRAQKREPEASNLLNKVPEGVLKQLNNQIFAASMYESYGNMEAATDAWLQVIRLGDQSTAVYQHLSEAAIAAQRWDAAYMAYEALGRATPDDVQVLNNLGTVADKINKRREALTALERSIQLKPAQPIVATQIGVIRLKNGDVNGARQAFELALSIDPSFGPARQHLERIRTGQPQR